MMFKRRNKPDLLFLLTVCVCLGVLVTATVNAAGQPGWRMTLHSDTACQQGLGEWQACSRWHASEPAPKQASLHLFHEQHPGLGVIWYHTQPGREKNIDINGLYANELDGLNTGYGQVEHFGLAVRQQYQHFGLSVGVESEHGDTQNPDTTLYFGISNRW